MSMPLDPYAGASVHDPVRLLQELMQRVAALEARERQRTGIPVTQSSGPLFIPDGTPTTPAGGAYLYSSGGVLFQRTSGGADRPWQGPAGHVAALAHPSGTPDNTISTLGPTYDENAINNNFRDVAAKLNDIRAKLIASGQMDPS